MDNKNESFEGTVNYNVLETLQEKFLRKFLIDTQPTDRKKEEMAMILDIYHKYGLSITDGQSLANDLAEMGRYLDMKYSNESEEDIEQ